MAGAICAAEPVSAAERVDANSSDLSSVGSERRVIAIGDIHGAYDELLAILHQVGLVDKRGRWSGGDSIFVQTGDILDRGAKSVQVATFLEKLQLQASKAGGEVIVLLGNHEALNLLGDLRYVTRDILAPFVDASSANRYTFYCNNYSKYVRRQAVLRGEEPPMARQVLSQCQDREAYGLVEYIEALSPEGQLGAWLRTLPTVAQVGDVVFLHGGIGPALTGRSIEDINRDAAEELAAFDQVRQRLLDERRILVTTHLRDVLTIARQLAQQETAAGRPVSPQLETVAHLESSLLVSDNGPLWFRGYAKWSEEEGLAKLPSILDPLGATRVVVGHTVQDSYRIVQRFDGQVLLIDTGMLKAYYKGQPSALEIRGDRWLSHTLGEAPQELSGVETAP